MGADPDREGAAHDLKRATEYRFTLLRRAGGALTMEQVKSVLGCTSTKAIREAVAARRLLAVDVSRVMLFPTFQFDGDHLVPGMAAVLAAAPDTNPWAILQYLVEGDEGLGNDLPMDLIKGSRADIARAVRFARTLEC